MTQNSTHPFCMYTYTYVTDRTSWPWDQSTDQDPLSGHHSSLPRPAGSEGVQRTLVRLPHSLCHTLLLHHTHQVSIYGTVTKNSYHFNKLARCILYRYMNNNNIEYSLNKSLKCKWIFKGQKSYNGSNLLTLPNNYYYGTVYCIKVHKFRSSAYYNIAWGLT